MRTLWISCCAAIGLLSACGSGQGVAVPAGPVSTPKASLQPKNFAADCGDFVAYVAESLTHQYLSVFQCYADAPCPMVAAGAAEGGDAPPAPTASPSPSPTRVSDTNTQERGVDEADIVKADARGYLYILSGHTLSVLDAHPAAEIDTAPLATLELASGADYFYARDLYLDAEAQRLVVFAEASSSDGRGDAQAILVDIASPTAPVETGRLGIDGYGIDSRRIAGRVHRVIGYQPPYPAWFFDSEDTLAQRREAYFKARNEGRTAEADQIRKEIGAEIHSRLRNAGAGTLLPRLRSQQSGGAASEATLACEAIAHPSVSEGMGFVLVDSFGTDGAARATAGLVNNAYLVYASPQNLYLAQPSMGWFFAPTQREETAIYRLALADTGAARFVGLGKVDGSLIGPYAMSEHEGYLRVASTESQFGPGRSESSNHLTVLDARREGDLPVVGQLRDLAPGERIQGARLLGPRGYLVTFRQVDPLFGIDLADPTRPRVLSELKLPGFSSYLAPIGDDYLLTVGRDGDDEGLNGQMAIQLFDVRDLAAIRQVASLSPAVGGEGYSYSVAEYDPHAFSYFPDRADAVAPGTLALPLYTDGETAQDRFSGFLVVRVEPGTETPLRESGRISHTGFAEPGEPCPTGPMAPLQPCEEPPPPPYVDPRRAVFMQDAAGTALLTISSVGVIASNAAEPKQELARRALPYDEPCCVTAATP